MKKRIYALKKFLILLILYMLGFQVDKSVALEICEAQLDCPGNYDGDTLVFPDNIVMLSPNFYHCSPTYFKEDITPGSIDTISLFFIIDHSASMSSTDSLSARYHVTAKMIDSLSAYSPASEVGIAIFSNQLLHNYQDDNNAVQLNPNSNWTDSYIPLTRLDKTVGDRSAVDYLKSVIKLDSTRDLGRNLKLVNGYYGQSGRHDGHEGQQNVMASYNGATDISLAFDAAREAFKKAIYPKSKQYIIFLSDGEPQFVDYERRDKINEYRSGDGLPATFTAFWINALQPIPQQIAQMTENIKNNGYSATNMLSTVWKTSGKDDDLLIKLLNITTGSGFESIPSTPVELTINGITTRQFTDSFANLPEPVMLGNPYTTLDISFTYHYAAPWNRDSTNTYKVVINSKPGVPVPADIKISCRPQGRIAFLVNGAEVTGTISDDDKNIEIRYYPFDNVTSGDVVLRIKNKSGSDSLLLNTASNDKYYFAQFTRATGSPLIDNILQNGDNDSVIAVYQNPKIAIDVVREIRRIGPARVLAPVKAWYLDQNADGFPDVIRVIQEKDRFQVDETEILKNQIWISATNGNRTSTVSSVVISSQGFDVLLATPSPNSKRFTGVYQNEQLRINAVTNLPGGGSIGALAVAIEDSMAPVIVKGAFTPGDQPLAGDDTLVVVFSENVAPIQNQSPFRFFDPLSNQNYLMTLSSIKNSNETHTFLVSSITGRESPGSADSIWINETAQVGDVNGKLQTNPANHRALLGRGNNTYSFSVITCPSPADPTTASVPATILNQLTNASPKGIVVMISSNKPIAGIDTISGKISIYDPLGLPVVKDERCSVSKSRDKIFFIWNGCNKKGRIVGNGIYSAIVKVSVSTGAKSTLKTKIGVLHGKN